MQKQKQPTKYACMTYQASFFTYSSIPDTTDVTKDGTQSSNEDRSSSLQSTEVKRTLTCRIALKALVPIVRTASIPPSELVVPPMVLLRLFETLQRTVEVALIVRGGTNHDNNIDIIDDELTTATNVSHRNSHGGSVSASSFHHSDSVNDATSDSATTNNNAILQATTASLLKTETACTSDDFVEFEFISNRRCLDSNIAHNCKVDSANAMPEDVNQEVILVFFNQGGEGDATVLLRIVTTLEYQFIEVHANDFNHQ
jgi:hypothetical protein